MSDALQLKIRSSLPLAYVLEQYGHRPVEQTDGRLHYHNPWRDDEHPSLDVYWEDGRQGRHQRAGDFADDNSWDVFGLVGKLMEVDEDRPVEFAEALVRTMELYYDWSNDREWEEPEIRELVERTPMGPERERELRADARPVPYFDTAAWRSAVDGPPARLGLRHALVLDTGTVFSRMEDGALVYLVRNPVTGELMGVSYRDAEGRKWYETGGQRFISTPMSEHDIVFGTKHEHYILVEGETDLFAAYATFRNEAHVWGIPGAGMHPARVGGDLIPEGSTATLAFDPDSAGMAATLKWVEYLTNRDISVRIAILPKGKDMARLRPDEQRRVVTSAQPYYGDDSPVQVVDGGYWRVRRGDEYVAGWADKETARQVTDWVLDLNAVLVDEEGLALGYRGTMAGREVVLPVNAMTPQKLSSWSSRHNGSVLTVSPSLVGELARYIRQQGNFLPRIPAYQASGLHSGGFVWEEGYTGLAEAAVLPNEGRAQPVFPATDDPDYLEWLESGGPADAYEALTSIYSVEVIQPLLAWHTASFIRSLLPKFPVAMVKGLSGTGKTTLLSELGRTFTGLSDPVAVDSITKYAMSVALESTNAFPLWLDEYRNSTSEAAKRALETAVLDVHGGARRASSRGGDHWNQVEAHARQAPLLISGEMGLKQLAHIERSATIDLNSGQRGDLKPSTMIPTGYVGRLIMDYLVSSGRSARIPPGVLAALNSSRPAFTQAVLEAGWYIFVDATLNPPVPEQFPDFEYSAQDAVDEASGVTEGTRLDVSLDHALEAVYSGKQNSPAIWTSQDGSTVFVNIPNFIESAGRRRDLDLPSSRPQDIADSLRLYYGSTPSKAVPPKQLWPDNQSQIRVHKIDAEALSWAGREQS